MKVQYQIHKQERWIFFYHPDHLGSTSHVTDADGNIATDYDWDYDWNRGGVGHRNSFIQWERNRKELDDSHRFKVFYYGVGKLNK